MKLKYSYLCNFREPMPVTLLNGDSSPDATDHLNNVAKALEPVIETKINENCEAAKESETQENAIEATRAKIVEEPFIEKTMVCAIESARATKVSVSSEVTNDVNLIEDTNPAIITESMLNLIESQITQVPLHRNSHRSTQSLVNLNSPVKRHKRQASLPPSNLTQQVPQCSTLCDSYYDWEKCKYIGKAWIIFTEDYKSAAQEMETSLKALNFEAETIKFKGKRRRKQFLKLLSEKGI